METFRSLSSGWRTWIEVLGALEEEFDLSRAGEASAIADASSAVESPSIESSEEDDEWRDERREALDDRTNEGSGTSRYAMIL